MHLPDLAAALALRSLPTPWVRYWQASGAETDRPIADLFSGATIDALSTRLAMPEPLRVALHEHLPLLEQPPLNRLFRLCHHVLYREKVHEGLGTWPTLDERQCPGASLFYAYLFLAGRDHMRRLHEARGIPEDVTDQTLADILIWMQEHHDKHGQWGLTNIGWVGNYVLKTKLIQLGRLQYVFNTFRLPLRGYRHRETDHVIVLAREGQKFRADGQFEGENRRLDPDGPWISTLHVTEQEIIGHAVTPDGTVERMPRRLDARRWEMVFDQGAPALSVHIPAGPGLTAEACRDSIRQAIAFYPKHFPDQPFDLVWCYSWLMDAQLKAYLAEDAKIIGFQNQFYLVPFPNTSGWQTFERVFGHANVDLATVEPRTSLQRAVLEHVRRGGAWRCPGGVIFPQRYASGSTSYRRADWDAPAREEVQA